METHENWRKTRQQCEGEIIFITANRYYPKHQFINMLRVQILDLIEASPWRDTSRNGDQLETCVTKPTLEFSHEQGGFEVKFCLRISSISPAQLYAFHGYMDSLAKHLAGLGMAGVRTVQGSVMFHLVGRVNHRQGSFQPKSI